GAGQVHHHVRRLEDGEGDGGVEEESDVGENAGKQVVGQHEDEHQRQTADAGVDAAVDRLLAKGGPDLLHLDHPHRDRQAAGVQQLGQVARLGDGEVAVDLASALGDRLVDLRRGDDVTVQDDRQDVAL